MPEYAVSKSEESQSEMPNNEISVIEGGPIENIQCSEKMWLIYDIHTSVYSDVHFVITGILFFLNNFNSNLKF